MNKYVKEWLEVLRAAVKSNNREASATVLPKKVAELFGIATTSGDYDPGPSVFSTTTLASQNDEGKTFAEIADIIEKAPDGLFKEQTPVEELIARLRSGAVKQGRTRLGTVGGERCCLGVACDIAVEHGVIPAPTPRENSFSLLYGAGPTSTTSLPKAVQEFFGFSSDTGSYHTKDRGYSSLMKLNDFLSKSFAEIADVIESRPKGLFVEDSPLADPEAAI